MKKRNPRAKPPKVFCIGFNKCGTASLWELFRKSGLPTVHWTFRVDEDYVNAAKVIHHNLVIGKPILSGVNQFVCYTDLNYVTNEIAIEGCRYFRQLYREYPNSYFILNTRDMERWIASRFAHGKIAYEWSNALGVDISEIGDIWRLQFTKHHQQVRRFFANKPGRFLEFDIETDDPSPIADFIAQDFAIDVAHWANRNPTSEARRRATAPRLG